MYIQQIQMSTTVACYIQTLFASNVWGCISCIRCIQMYKFQVQSWASIK